GEPRVALRERADRSRRSVRPAGDCDQPDAGPGAYAAHAALVVVPAASAAAGSVCIRVEGDAAPQPGSGAGGPVVLPAGSFALRERAEEIELIRRAARILGDVIHSA